MNIRYPNITGQDPSTQITQIRGWLHQLVDQLNMDENSKGTDIRKTKGGVSSGVDTSAQPSTSGQTPLGAFNAIKALIIKSADIVNAYYDEIVKLIDQKKLYVAKSDFGTFKDTTINSLIATVNSLNQHIESIEQIFGPDGQILDERICSGYLKSGLLYEDPAKGPVFGLEIGQRNTATDGEEVFNQFARFTADELAFFDKNGVKSGMIGDRRMYIPEAHISKQKTMGHFVDIVNTNGSITTKYIPWEVEA